MGNAPGEDVTLTPPEIWERLERVPGPGGSLWDPCPHPWTRDGLTEEWPHAPGQVDYCNPPFSALHAWSSRCGEYAERGRTVIALVPCRTSQPYWRVLNEHANTVAYWTGDKDIGGAIPRRIRFLTRDGRRMAGAPFDAALFLLTTDLEHRARFRAAFADVSTIVTLRRS